MFATSLTWDSVPRLSSNLQTFANLTILIKLFPAADSQLSSTYKLFEHGSFQKKPECFRLNPN